MDGVSLSFDMFVVACIDNELRLFPKNFTDNGLGTNKVKLSTGNTANLSIFKSGTVGKGLMITDATCYSKLVTTFKLIKTSVMINTIGDKSESVPISGFLFDI